MSVHANARHGPAPRTYAVYGVQVQSNFQFPSLAPLNPSGLGLFDSGKPHAAPPDPGDAARLSFSCPAPLPPVVGPAVFIHPQRLPDGRPLLSVFPTPAGHRLLFPGVAEFSLEGDSARAAPLPGAAPQQVEAAFLSIVMALWLELRGLRCLHAAAIVRRGQAVALLAESGHGKSTLAGACLAAGAPLLSDDILPVCLAPLAAGRSPSAATAHPGYPRLGLWAPQAAALGLHPRSAAPPEAPSAEDKLRLPLDAAAFYHRPAPLAGLLLLQREDEDMTPRLEPVSGQHALMALVRFSFLPRLSAALGLDAARLAALAQLAAAVPMRRLVYPSGIHRLGEVVQAVFSSVKDKE